ncbi:MAG: RNA polymerase sigma factor [Planctomycetota bacterium]|nr:RNA polymerase sigma factor [Planctomycetota bacterium]
MKDSNDIPLKREAGAEYGDSMENRATQLMLASKAGDEDAFTRLVRSVGDRAQRVAQGLVGSPEDARDLCQEAFLKTWKARGTYRDDAPFLPWFHRILRNTCFSFLRKQGRIKKSSLSAGKDDDGTQADWDLVDDSPLPSHGPEQEETTTLFWEAMNRLSARDREILVLRQFQDLSYRAIAHALDIPEGTVMSRLFHARRRLRDLLEPHLDGALSDYASTEQEAE